MTADLPSGDYVQIFYPTRAALSLELNFLKKKGANLPPKVIADKELLKCAVPFCAHNNA
jgi:hypothetical protein